MRDALEHVNRTILYSLCEWGDADVNEWGLQTGNSWRMSGDIQRMYPYLFPITHKNVVKWLIMDT